MTVTSARGRGGAAAAVVVVVVEEEEGEHRAIGIVRGLVSSWSQQWEVLTATKAYYNKYYHKFKTKSLALIRR